MIYDMKSLNKIETHPSVVQSPRLYQGSGHVGSFLGELGGVGFRVRYEATVQLYANRCQVCLYRYRYRDVYMYILHWACWERPTGKASKGRIDKGGQPATHPSVEHSPRLYQGSGHVGSFLGELEGLGFGSAKRCQSTRDSP